MSGVSNPFLALPTNRAAKPGVHRSGYGPTLTRNTVSFNGQRLEKLSTSTPEQGRVFELLGKPIPLLLDAA